MPREIKTPRGVSVTFGFLPCECAEAQAERGREEAEAKAEEERREQKKRELRYERAGIPRRYWDAETDVAAYLETLHRGVGLFFTGKVGRGKTYAACVIVKRLVDSGIRAYFSDVERIEREAKDARASFQSEQEIIDRYVHVPVLVLDDLGAEKVTTRQSTILRALISGREAEDRPTVYTSNLDRKGFAKHIAEAEGTTMAERLASRLAGSTEVVVFDGEDRRLNREVVNA